MISTNFLEKIGTCREWTQRDIVRYMNSQYQQGKGWINQLHDTVASNWEGRKEKTQY